MTPSEKAKELYIKAYKIIQKADKYAYLLRDEEAEFSKEIAKITVNEILDFYSRYEGGIDSDEYCEQVEYWKNVYKEIEKYKIWEN